jgi:SAM-dependent methyltransferase
MLSPAHERPSLLGTAARWWRDAAAIEGRFAATSRFLAVMWEFLRDSTPERRRLRYGDADFDWEHRVDTTSATVNWRDRLLGVFHSAYQPTEAALFHKMMSALGQLADFDFSQFAFIDLGSGKGRTLLMAAEYPFRRIVGIELLPALHQVALQNLSRYHNPAQRCFSLEAHCQDATEFELPAEPAVIYLFNPFSEAGLRRVIAKLEQNLQRNPRPVYVLYHNPLLERVLQASAHLKKIAGTHQYSLYASSKA